MAGPNPAEGYATPAFEEEPRGRTSVRYGNHEDSASRDDASRIDLLTAQVSDLLARVDVLETRLQDLEGDPDDEWDGGDEEPPV